MRKLINYIANNLTRIILIFLASLSFVILIVPVLVNVGFVKDFFVKTPADTFVGIMALLWLLLVYFWEKARKWLERFRNTWSLGKPPFLSVNCIFLFIIFSVVLTLLFNHKLSLSVEFKSFFGLNFIAFLSWLVAAYYWKEDKKETEPQDIDAYFLSDEPIQFTEQDLLGREKFVDGLYKELTSLPFADSFVFGLYGSWGEGKTSVMNLLRNKFKGNENFLVINFDPWHFKDEDSILANFYGELERAISEKYIFSGLKKTFSKYQRLISSGLSHAGIKIDLSFIEESVEELKQRIESYITEIENKLIIFVDDVDRLHSDEMLLIFKLVRLNAKFKNTVFVLSFDPVLVQKYLNENANADPEFLDKIVQKPVPLPAIEQRNIDQFWDHHVDKLFDELKIPNQTRTKFAKDFPYIYQTQIRKIFKTLRHVKRYLNGLRSTLPPIKNEVNLCDFFILEIIRVFYPRAYNDIWRNPWYYIPLNWSDETYFLSPFGPLANQHDEKYSQIRGHVENIIQNEKEPEVLKELLQVIFFVEVKNALSRSRTGHDSVAKNYRVEKRITHPESFRKYFMLKVPPEDISDEFVETTLDLWHSTKNTEKESLIEKTIFDIQKKEKLLEFFKKLIVFLDRIENKTAYEIMRVIYKNVNKFSKKGTENLWNSEYDKANALLLWLVNEKIQKGKIHKTLEEVVTSTPDLTFAVSIVLSCRKERGGSLFAIYDSAKVNELQDKVADRLKKYFIEDGRDIFDQLKDKQDWALVLHQWATNWMTFTGSNNKIVNNYLLSLLKADAKKFVLFLMSQRKRTASDGWAYNLDELGRIYSLNEFQKLAEKFKEEKSLSEEERQSIAMFLRLHKERETQSYERESPQF